MLIVHHFVEEIEFHLLPKLKVRPAFKEIIQEIVKDNNILCESQSYVIFQVKYLSNTRLNVCDVTNLLFKISPVVVALLDLPPTSMIESSFITTDEWWNLSWLVRITKIMTGRMIMDWGYMLARCIQFAWPDRQKMQDRSVSQPPHATRSPLLLTDREWPHLPAQKMKHEVTGGRECWTLLFICPLHCY